MYTYLILNIATIIFPLILSFEKNLRFIRFWNKIVPALLIVAALFLVWDHYFTAWGIWKFNPQYVMGIFWFGLPMEEWFFFFTVPYACMFVYGSIKYYDKFSIPPVVLSWISVGLSLFLVALSFVFREKMYTSITFAVGAIALGIHLVFFGQRHLNHFYQAFVVQVIPFLVVNGILTSLPVLIYNNHENLGVRIWTIPIEDLVYSMILLLLNVSLFEGFNSYSQNVISYGTKSKREH